MFSSLEELFGVEVNVPKKQKFESEDYLDLRIPVCQHNMYKYSPYHVSAVSEGYRIVFPEQYLSHVKNVDVDLGDISVVSVEDIVNIEYRTEEERGKLFYQLIFCENEGFGIDELFTQFYLSQANDFNYERWYSPIADLMLEENHVVPQSWIIELDESEIVEIARLYEESNRGRSLSDVMGQIHQLARGVQVKLENSLPEELLNDNFFFKLNTRSPKDSWYYKDQGFLSQIIKKDDGKNKPKERCQARNAIDVISALVASERTGSDSQSWIEWKVKEKPPLCLIVQNWVDFPSKYEFRCWIFEGTMTAINPLCYPNYYPEFDREKDRINVINAALAVQRATHDLIPFDSYILDVIFDKKKNSASICEYNPWGPYSCTGTQLFSWELDYDIMFGISHRKRIENGEESLPNFRSLKRGMKVVEMFDLCLASEYYFPTDSFVELVQSVTQQCPCCPRRSRPNRPKTELVVLE